MLQRAPATALSGMTHKCVLMIQHLELVAQLANAFGNENFDELLPKEIMEHAAANHDAGWYEKDLTMSLDPVAHIPRGLLFAPPGTSVEVGSKSADIGEAFHAYSGLLISLHHTGLQQGRYGEGGGKVPAFAEMVSESKQWREASGEPATAQASIEDWLAKETERQERIKAALSNDAATAPWVSNEALWTNYRAMQFFDTLALYFCLAAEHDRPSTPLEFPKVPTSVSGKSTTVKVTRIHEGRYTCEPYPFNRSPLTVTLAGSLVKPDASLANALAMISKGALHVETITLEPAK
uniref:DUF3891 family protein n=1 Tax=Coccolithus braarudii TaxID=221442 RepID=A0A7S0LGU7_9EUKA